MRKIVLIDDEVYARKGLCGLISWNELGYDIAAEAADGEEGLALIQRIQPDLVITDIRMPVVDGLSLIRTVREQNLSDAKFIVITGYNDFSYAQQAVRYGVDDLLLKPIDEEELKDTLRRISSKLKPSGVHPDDTKELDRSALQEQLLLGRADVRISEEAAGAALGWNAGDELRYVLVEWNDAPAEDEHKTAAELARMKKAVSEFLERAGEGSRAILQDQGPYAFGFVAKSRCLRDYSGSWERFAEGLHRIVAKTCEAGSVPRVYMGSSFRSPREAADSYRSAGGAVLHKYALADQPVVMAEQTIPLTLQYRDLDQKRAKSLLESLEEHDLDAALEIVDRMFEDFRKERFAPESINACISSYALGIAGIIGNMEGNEAQLASLRSVLQWNKRPMTLSGLKRLFVGFIRESSAYMAELRIEKAKGGIHKVKSYIETHYQDNISLKSIAKRFYMNPVYLGQLFKKTYHVYFNEYLLNIRIQEAKRLLRQTDLKVYEIASKVGFSNSDYFVTQFEKVERKTPMEYKNSLIARH